MKHSQRAHRLLAGSAAIAMIGVPAFASPLLSAVGTITLPTATTNYSNTADNNPVNIIPYTGDSTSSGFIHAYGDPSGTFGARSSGQGVFNVFSSITYTDTIFNNTGVTQDALLNFHISGGEVSVSGSGSSDAKLNIDIKRGTNTVASALVESASNNGTITTSIDGSGSSIPGFSTYAIAGGFGIADQSGTVDLGSVGAGHSLTYSYAISALAAGSVNPGSFHEQIITECHEYGPYTEVTVNDGYGYGYGNFRPNTVIGTGGSHKEIRAAGTTCEQVTILVPNSADNYAIARSGDPLNAGFGDGQIDGNGNAHDNTGFPGFPSGDRPRVTFNTPVPEPSTLALVAAGLGLTRLRRRRAA